MRQKKKQYTKYNIKNNVLKQMLKDMTIKFQAYFTLILLKKKAQKDSNANIF